MKRLGWAIAGAVLGLAASAFAAVLAADRGTRTRFATASRQGRQWAQETGGRWSAGATQSWDRVTETTDQLRGRVVGTAEEWRDRSSQDLGRRLLSAAEARDKTLEDDDTDEDEA